MVHKPGDQPSADFEAFFTVFNKALEQTNVPGMIGGGSWDRRAAYMLYQYGNSQASFRDYINWVLQGNNK